MARPTRAGRPGRALLALLTLFVVLYGTIAAAHFHGTGTLTPKLGLDLEGGDEIVLQPVTTGTVSQGTINQAINIIRNRVNGTGISEAQVTSQGGKNIVVDLPAPEPGDQEPGQDVGPAPLPRRHPAGRDPPDTDADRYRHRHLERRRAPRPPRRRRPAERRPNPGSSATKSTSGRAIPKALAAAPTPSATPTARARPPRRRRRRVARATTPGAAHGRERPQLGDAGPPGAVRRRDLHRPEQVPDQHRRPGQALRHLLDRRHDQVHPGSGRGLRHRYQRRHRPAADQLLRHPAVDLEGRA